MIIYIAALQSVPEEMSEAAQIDGATALQTLFKIKLPMLIQYFRGSYGSVQMGPMMASIMLTVLPAIVFYITLQKYIVKGVAAGAVKG